MWRHNKIHSKNRKPTIYTSTTKAHQILNRHLNLPNTKTNTSKSLNKENLINFYNDKYEKSLQEGDLDKVFELSCKSDEITNKKYNIIYPFLSKKVSL